MLRGSQSWHRLSWLLVWVPIGFGATAHAQSAGPAGSRERSRSHRSARPATSASQMAAAKEFYERGEALFVQGRYDAAWVEFSSAYQMAQLPELLYNLARSEEKLNRPADAAKHYRQFLEGSPDDREATQVRQKIAELEQQAGLTAPAAATPPPPPEPPEPEPAPIALRLAPPVELPPPAAPAPHRTPVYSAIAGGSALVFTLIGTAALGSARSKYDDFVMTCAPHCPMGDVVALQPTIQTGQAFLALGAIFAVGTAGLLYWELRRSHPERKTVLRAAPLSLSGY